MDEVLIVLLLVVVGATVTLGLPILLITLLSKLNRVIRDIDDSNKRRNYDVSRLRSDLTEAFNQLSSEIKTVKTSTIIPCSEEKTAVQKNENSIVDEDVIAKKDKASQPVEINETKCEPISPTKKHASIVTESTVEEKSTSEKTVAKKSVTVVSMIHETQQVKPDEKLHTNEPVVADVEETTEDIYSSSRFGQVLEDIREWLLVGDKYRAEGVLKEYAIATNWLVRIGIIIIVLGIAFGLRYSYKHGWVTPPFRIALSSFLGVLFTYLGLKMEGKRYELLGHGFLGGGITTLYFSVFSATHLYDLITPATGFIVMALITAACGVISVKFESKLVAILGIAGGYVTPLLMSTRSGALGSLYIYMTLLGIGVLGITVKRNWYIIQYFAFICHWILFFLAIDRYYNSSFFTVTMIALPTFFLIFAFNSCVYHLTKKLTLTLVELSMLLINTVAFAGVTAIFISDEVSDERYIAILTISLALFYVLCSRMLLQLKHKDRGFVLSCIGMSGFFTAISLPILLDAGWLTISWSLQAFFMLWLSQRLTSNFLKLLSYGLYVIAIISLFHTSSYIYSPRQQEVYMNLAGKDYFLQLLTNLIQIGVPVMTFIFGRRVIASDVEPSPIAIDKTVDIEDLYIPTADIVSVVLRFLVVALGFSFLFLETRAFFTNFCLILKAPALTLVITILVIYLGKRLKQCKSDAIFIAFCLALLALTIKIVVYDPSIVWELNEQFVYGNVYSFKLAGIRLINFALFMATVITIYKSINREKVDATIRVVALVLSLAVPFLAISFEVNSLLLDKLPGLQAGGISIFWSSYGMCLLVFGICKQVKPLRYAGLILFAIVSVKVFAVDLANLSEFWKILAFIILGVILLAGSWVYIKYQHLFISNDEEK